MGSSVAILTEDLYEDVEFWYPFYRLKEAGHRVTVIGSDKKDSFQGKHGIPNKADMGIKQADPTEFDAVVVPGGYAPDRMRLHPGFAAFVRSIYVQGKLVASLCHGPWVLASADIIRNKTVTCWPSLKDDMGNAGAHYVDQEVVVDGRIITSRSPDDLPAFMREVIKALAEPESVKERVAMAPSSR
jgi:protease I